ncbi:MAG: COX15/CtaA family protein [Verrucomicrobiae bacterium]|nr:COX15/CtaA family protein [Verrucomicrobiae bacterium]
MNRLPTNRWLHGFAVLTALATFVLLGAGGLVTSKGVGMAVPDWPNTYGYNMFLFPVSQWIGGIFYEHSHRLIGAGVGLLTAVLAAWLWTRETTGRSRWLGIGGIALTLVLMSARLMPVYLALATGAVVVIVLTLRRFVKRPDELRWLGLTALAAVILQGVLGGLRVVWIQDELGIVHATLAQLFFVLVCVLALFTSRWWRETVNRSAAEPEDAKPVAQRPFSPEPARLTTHKLALAVTLLILGQLILGATMRHQHAGLAIPDFPLAYGRLWPAMDAESVARYNQQRIEVLAHNPITAFQIALQMAHRLVALAILVGVAAVAWRAKRFGRGDGDRVGAVLRRLAWGWLSLIVAQVALGAWTIWSNKAADVATAHVLVGALSLVAGALWCVIGLRCRGWAAEAAWCGALKFPHRQSGFAGERSAGMISGVAG